jgi:predicted DsbA family dithiol-disulfide isomerase
MKNLEVDVISDVICPWCFIGSRRLEQALTPPPDGVTVDVTFRPFLLDPTTPREGADLRERLRAKYGGDPEKMFASVEAAAHATGIPLDFSRVRRTPSTVAAHTLLRHAIAKGTQVALARGLFEAHFLEGRDIGDVDVLASIADGYGFDSDEALRILGDDREWSTTLGEARQAAAKGVRGVPFFILGGRLTVSGAQSAEVLRGALERAIAEGDGSPVDPQGRGEVRPS